MTIKTIPRKEYNIFYIADSNINEKSYVFTEYH